MTANPHPLTMVQFARQRHAELQELADRERLARCVQTSPRRGAPWAELAALTAVGLALTLLLAAGSAGA